jgi:hypothetical protein
MADLTDRQVTQAIEKSAHDNLGVDIDLTDSCGMDDLAVALFGQTDIERVHAFVEDLKAAGIKWDDVAPPQTRPKMEYRVYDAPAEAAAFLLDDEPSVGRNMSRAAPLLPHQMTGGESNSRNASVSNKDTSDSPLATGPAGNGISKGRS